MRKSEGIAYLTQCADRNGDHWYQGIRFELKDCPACKGTNNAGNLWCGSEFGTYTDDCAPVAWRVAYVWSDGEEITKAMLDDAMSLVINQPDEVKSLIRTHGGYRYR